MTANTSAWPNTARPTPVSDPRLTLANLCDKSSQSSETYVTDPAPEQRSDRCEFKIHPNADEVIICDSRAVAVISAPCCGQGTLMCHECLGKGGVLGSWRCDGCGIVTDCQHTAMEFSLRWLA